MSKNRYGKRIDANQPEIVEQLLELPCVTVELDRDDIYVGYKGVNYWIEIKDPKRTLRQDGRIRPDTFKESQIDLLRDWTGQYAIAWTFEEVLDIIGFRREEK